MSLNKNFNEDLVHEEAPEEIEHDLIKDSVLQIANTDFKLNDDFDELPVGIIRRNVVEELSEEYKGKPVSRKAFSQRNWIHDNVVDSEEGSEGENVKGFDEGSIDEGDESDEDEISEQIFESEEDEDRAMQSDEEESEGSGEESRNRSEVDEGGINIFSNRVKTVDDDIKKGTAIKNQLILWENLIECRIKLQKGLAASNRLLQKEMFAQFKSQLTSEEESTVTTAYNSLIELLENFIQLKECIIKKCPEYTSFKKNGTLIDTDKKSSKDDDDEEITSESENEREEELVHDELDEVEYPPAKKRKTLHDYSDHLSNQNDDYRPFRDSVIQKWNDKTRLASGKIGISKFAILEQSTLKQIEQILLDKDRLIKRTQTRRSKLPVLGKEKKKEPDSGDELPDEDPDVPEKPKSNEEVLDCEIFDDDDFYHKLLKDFIDRKTSDVTDPTQLGRQWMKLQKLRCKMKKKVDTRATKGRKIRYTVHNKLVNFMAPIPYSNWDDKVEQDLFRSLFGQASLKVTAHGQ